MNIRVLIPILVAAFSCAAASAVPYADLQLPNKKLTAGTSQARYESTFDLNNPGNTATWLGYSDIDGFDPGTMDANSGFVEFLLIDHNLDVGVEKFKVYLDDDLLSSGSFKLANWILIPGISAELLLEISETGLLDYEIKATSGSFTLVGAYLQVNGVPENAVGVPDGGLTLGLLGIGLLGLGALKRSNKA